MFKGLDHININTAKLEDTRRFFVEVLGFNIGPRPDFGIPGYWLQHKGRDIVHLMEMSASAAPVTGPLDHFALAVEDHEAMRAHLDRLNIPYTEFGLPDGSRKQLMIKDPNGITVELNWRAH